MGRGLGLALIAHGLLILALAWSVNWKTSEPEGVVAELWSALPQIAAPRVSLPEPSRPVVEPRPPVPVPVPRPEPVTPPRVDAQIAVERAEAAKKAEAVKRAEAAKREEARRLEVERERERLAEEQADKKKLAEKTRQDQARDAAIREANLRRMMKQAGTSDDPAATGNATRTSGPSASYGGRIKAAIRPNITLPGSTIAGNPLAVVEVRLATDGSIVSQRLVKSSGSAAWDEAVLRAVEKTRVLPRDEGRVYSPMTLEFRPQD